MPEHWTYYLGIDPAAGSDYAATVIVALIDGKWVMVDRTLEKPPEPINRKIKKGSYRTVGPLEAMMMGIDRDPPLVIDVTAEVVPDDPNSGDDSDE